MRVKVSEIVAAAKQKSTEFTDMYHNATSMERLGDPREPYLRPSSLPVCSVRFLASILEWKIGYCETNTFTADFFMTVGTAVHEVVERWASQPGYRLWGNWKCPTCQHIWQYTDDNTCPKGCEAPGRYQEIEIAYMGFKGHIDCILLTPTGVLIGDYKTSSKYGTEKPTFREHNKAYPLQIMAYSYMMHRIWGPHFLEKYKLKIRGCSLLFICRDNPFKTREFMWDARFALPNGRKILYHGLLAWRGAVRAFEQKNVDKALARRNCRDKKDYAQNVKPFHTYDDCWLYDKCVGSGKGFKPLYKYFDDLWTELEALEQDQA